MRKELDEILQEPKEPTLEESLLRSFASLPSVGSEGFSSPSIYNFSKNSQNQEIVELYGDDLDVLSLEERAFIENNLSIIGKITQSYLRYPDIAGRIGQQGQNILEFYLYPNGDISDLKIVNSSGYSLLDNNSKHTVEIAYKDYPYPSVKTKIRIKVHYHIY